MESNGLGYGQYHMTRATCTVSVVSKYEVDEIHACSKLLHFFKTSGWLFLKLTTHLQFLDLLPHISGVSVHSSLSLSLLVIFIDIGDLFSLLFYPQ
jgi:hypothetical protein